MEGMMNIVSVLSIIFLVAFLVESMVEYFLGLPIDNVEALEKARWALPYVAAVAGVVLAFVYRFDLVALLAAFLGQPGLGSPAGVILTGLAIGRGSSFVHDIASKYFVKQE